MGGPALSWDSQSASLSALETMASSPPAPLIASLASEQTNHHRGKSVFACGRSNLLGKKKIFF